MGKVRGGDITGHGEDRTELTGWLHVVKRERRAT